MAHDPPASDKKTLRHVENTININSPEYPDLHLACCTDARYFTHVAATLCSVLHNHPHRIVHVHLIASGVNSHRLSRLRLFVGGYNGILHVYTPPEKVARHFQVRSSARLTTAAYYRCYLSELLPKELERVLYLDGDLIVRRKLDEFYDQPLAPYSAVVVRDYGNITKQDLRRLQFSETAVYFNSGVMLVNLEYWRKAHVAEHCIQYFSEHPERIVYDDQDLLNVVLAGTTAIASPTWNAQDFFYRRDYVAATSLSKEEYAKLIKDPAVVHFTRTPKPWQWKCLHPFRDEYEYYLRRTPWRKQERPHQQIFRLKRGLRKALVGLHIVKPRFRKARNKGRKK